MQFSDTIACVLFELLVFGIVYRVLSKHVQGSTSFSIVQFSRSCAGRLADSSFIISHQVSFVKHFFEIFLSRSAFRPARCLGDSLFILLQPKSFVKTFFEVFSSSFSNRSADPVAHALSVTVLRGRPEAVQL